MRGKQNPRAGGTARGAIGASSPKSAIIAATEARRDSMPAELIGSSPVDFSPGALACNRRTAETFKLRAGALQYSCTVGRFPDVRIGELFLSNHRANSTADTNARDAAIFRLSTADLEADDHELRSASEHARASC